MTNIIQMIQRIPVYGACGVLGFSLGIIYLYYIAKQENEKFGDLIYIYVWAGLGAIIGAKILYLIVNLKEIIEALTSDTVHLGDYLMELLRGGFVFYGGLIGAVITIRLSSKFFGYQWRKMLELLIPAMPLAHAFGRLGCHIVGCCYGMEVQHGIYKIYEHSQYAPHGVKLFPVQIVEAGWDLIIFASLLWAIKRKRSTRRITIFEQYVFLYAAGRFILEFLRGDELRGSLGALSTSQWISVILIGICAFSCVLRNSQGNSEQK